MHKQTFYKNLNRILLLHYRYILFKHIRHSCAGVGSPALCFYQPDCNRMKEKISPKSEINPLWDKCQQNKCPQVKVSPLSIPNVYFFSYSVPVTVVTRSNREGYDSMRNPPDLPLITLAKKGKNKKILPLDAFQLVFWLKSVAIDSYKTCLEENFPTWTTEGAMLLSANWQIPLSGYCILTFWRWLRIYSNSCCIQLDKATVCWLLRFYSKRESGGRVPTRPPT